MGNLLIYSAADSFSVWPQGGGELRGRTMRQLTTVAALVVALVTPASARSRLVVVDRPTLACSDQQALETALTLARLHDRP